MEYQSITASEIASMDYNRLIAMVRETNRPPGGLQTVARIASKAFIGPNKHVLEIGTSTGFTAVELAQLTGARVTAIDINRDSLLVAEQRARERRVQDRCEFSCEDAHNLPYDDESFDVVMCGNVTSLLSDRGRALKEYLRVLRTGGFLATVPMYYIEMPPAELLNNVSKAIQVDIDPVTKNYWGDFFRDPQLCTFFSEDYLFDRVPPRDVDLFVTTILSRPHLKRLSPAALQMLRSKYRNYMMLFRDNLALMGFTIMLLQRIDPRLDVELFTGTAAGTTRLPRQDRVTNL